MFLTLLLGFIAGLGLIIYKGLYFGPWPEALNTMGTAIVVAIVFYIFLQILANIGGFFLKVFLVILFSVAILVGGQKLWNAFNPDNPIVVPAAITNSFEQIKAKLW